jgi:hypothetical protein
MSLAYLAETAIVFNLAYLELKKTRYIENVRKRIADEKNDVERAADSRTKQSGGSPPAIGQSPPDAAVAETVAFTKADEEFKKSLDDMLSADAETRCRSWFDGNHKDWLSKNGYEIFESGADKRVTQRTLTLSTLLLVALIVCDRFGMDRPLSFRAEIFCGIAIAASSVFCLFGAYQPFRHANKICVGLFAGSIAIPLVFHESLAALSATPDFHLGWWLFFALLAICNLVPAAFVSLGRKIQTTLNSSIDKAKKTREKAQQALTTPFVEQAAAAAR